MNKNIWEYEMETYFTIAFVSLVILVILWIIVMVTKNHVSSREWNEYLSSHYTHNFQTDFSSEVTQRQQQRAKKKAMEARTYKIKRPGYTIFCHETRSLNRPTKDDDGSVRSLLGELFGSRTVDIPSNAICVSIPTKFFRTGRKPYNFHPISRNIWSFSSFSSKKPKFQYEMWANNVQAVTHNDMLVGICIFLGQGRPRIDVGWILSKMRHLVIRYSSEWRPPLVYLLPNDPGEVGGHRVRNTISSLMSRIHHHQHQLHPILPATIHNLPPLRRPPPSTQTPVSYPRDTPSPVPTDNDSVISAPPEYSTIIIEDNDDNGTPPPLYWSIQDQKCFDFRNS